MLSNFSVGARLAPSKRQVKQSNAPRERTLLVRPTGGGGRATPEPAVVGAVAVHLARLDRTIASSLSSLSIHLCHKGTPVVTLAFFLCPRS